MKYLGIDFGLKRIGLAISEGNLATPLKVVEVKGLKDAVEKITQIAKQEKFDHIIVGLSEGKMGKTITGFINALKSTGLNVETADETLSSQRATLKMIELNLPQIRRRINDAYSAAIILQNYLDSLEQGGP